jgi:PAS domain S-box-containing protein
MEADAQSLELVLEALQRSEQRYRSLVEATASFVWVARPDGALISDMPRWREITGQSVDELLGSGWMEVIHPDDRPAVAAAWRQAVRQAGPYAVEYRIRERDGGLRHLFVRGTPVFAPDGRVREFIGLCIDVTERAQLVDALDQERAVL